MMLTGWRMSVRMEPELDAGVMAALADTLVPLFDEETDCAVHFVEMRLIDDDRAQIEALRASFTPRAVGFAPIAAPVLRRLLTRLEFAENLEIRFFSLDAGRITICLHGADLTITTEHPKMLLALTQAVMATEEDFDADWLDDPMADDEDSATGSHDELLLRQTASGS